MKCVCIHKYMNIHIYVCIYTHTQRNTDGYIANMYKHTSIQMSALCTVGTQ